MDGHLAVMPFGTRVLKYDNGQRVKMGSLQQDRSTERLVQTFLEKTEAKKGGRTLRRVLDKKLKPRRNKAMACQDYYKVNDNYI